MKKLLLVILTFAIATATLAQDTATEPEEEISDSALSAAISDFLNARAYADSINSTITYQTGKVILGDDLAVIEVPKGFKYLDPQQSTYVLTELWGNPAVEPPLGMLFPEEYGPLDDSSWAFEIDYEDIGFVEDHDAEDIDYDELLTELQEETKAENPKRIAAGYEPIELIGWAATPFYNPTNNTLHWAKELKFGDDEQHTLNYNTRILGRKGVLVLNAIGTIDQLKFVEPTIPDVLTSVSFSDGMKYADFDPDIDEVAAWTVGGLVAGKILAKAGFFALILKFWKIIAAGVIGIFGFLFKRNKNKQEAAIASATSSVESTKQDTDRTTEA